jgi:predicted transcriptional regulator
MKPPLHLKDEIRSILLDRGREGYLQADFHSRMGFSKSRVSEILEEMLGAGDIVIRKEAGRSNRAWLSQYYPGRVAGIIRVGMLPSVEYLYHLAAIKDRCRRHGDKLLVTLYQRSADILENLLAGTLDFGFSPLVSYIMHPENKSLRIISDVATGGSSIFENPSCLNRKIISSEFSSMALLTKAFEKVSGELEVTGSGSAGSALAAFLRGETRYIAIWEPFATQLRDNADIHEVFRFSDTMDSMPCCCLGTTSIRLENMLSEVQEILSNIKRIASDQKIEGTISEQVKFFSGILEVDKAVIRRSLSQYSFLSGSSADSIARLLELIGISMSGDTIKAMVSLR